MISKLLFIPTIHHYENRTLPRIDPKKEGVTRLITIGDSITSGPPTGDYPSQLMDMLKDDTKFEVVNLGASGHTMMKTGDAPYWDSP